MKILPAVLNLRCETSDRSRLTSSSLIHTRPVVSERQQMVCWTLRGYGFPPAAAHRPDLQTQFMSELWGGVRVSSKRLFKRWKPLKKRGCEEGVLEIWAGQNWNPKYFNGLSVCLSAWTVWPSPHTAATTTPLRVITSGSILSLRHVQELKNKN